MMGLQSKPTPLEEQQRHRPRTVGGSLLLKCPRSLPPEALSSASSCTVTVTEAGTPLFLGREPLQALCPHPAPGKPLSWLITVDEWKDSSVLRRNHTMNGVMAGFLFLACPAPSYSPRGVGGGRHCLNAPLPGEQVSTYGCLPEWDLSPHHNHLSLRALSQPPAHSVLPTCVEASLCPP